MTIAETLNQAADLIEERGWWRPGHFEHHGFDRGIGGECALLAVKSVADFPHDIEAALSAFTVHVGGDVTNTHDAVPAWNDVQASGTVVVEALRAAALVALVAEVEAGVLSPA